MIDPHLVGCAGAQSLLRTLDRAVGQGDIPQEVASNMYTMFDEELGNSLSKQCKRIPCEPCDWHVDGRLTELASLSGRWQLWATGGVLRHRPSGSEWPASPLLTEGWDDTIVKERAKKAPVRRRSKDEGSARPTSAPAAGGHRGQKRMRSDQDRSPVRDIPLDYNEDEDDFL